jgi:hypothetical protein
MKELEKIAFGTWFLIQEDEDTGHHDGGRQRPYRPGR